VAASADRARVKRAESAISNRAGGGGLTFRSQRLRAAPGAGRSTRELVRGINPDSHPGADALARAREAR